MFGWRARIGYLCPSVFEMIAYDFYRIVPSGVGLVGVTCMIDGWQDDAYRKGLARIEECARELGRRNCDFIIHAGVPLVISQGLGYEREVISKVETLARVPATTSIVAGMEALRLCRLDVWAWERILPESVIFQRPMCTLRRNKLSKNPPSSRACICHARNSLCWMLSMPSRPICGSRLSVT
jgi:hypothetical protein